MNNEGINGILIVDKPKGLTSHDIVDFIRKRFRIKKVGHAGTLDPQATGVLVVLLGSFTKLSEKLTLHDKEYDSCLTLGIATDSQDAEGRVIKRQKVVDFSLEKAKQVFSQFLGKIEQIPPMFSALKIKGRRLYTLARQGVEIGRPLHQVCIYKLEITKFAFPDIYFVVKCSKGTYIRTLCVDIAERLGYPGYMSKLRRIKSGTFLDTQAISLDKLNRLSFQQLREALLKEF